MGFRAWSALSRPVLAAAAAGLLLTGCTGGREAVGEALGFAVESPNPFNVVPRAPLRLPGDLAALPPPEPGAPSPLEPRPEAIARSALSLPDGQDAASAGAPTPGELGLLEAAGADLADPRIRATLAEERPERERQYGLTSILGYTIPDGSEEEILTPREETERLREQGVETPNPPPEPPEPPPNTWILGG
ncbi:MAG: DUF3035 domain-containing protein [Pseudomonadota bacterium]